MAITAEVRRKPPIKDLKKLINEKWSNSIEYLKIQTWTNRRKKFDQNIEQKTSNLHDEQLPPPRSNSPVNSMRSKYYDSDRESIISHSESIYERLKEPKLNEKSHSPKPESGDTQITQRPVSILINNLHKENTRSSIIRGIPSSNNSVEKPQYHNQEVLAAFSRGLFSSRRNNNLDLPLKDHKKESTIVKPRTIKWLDEVDNEGSKHEIVDRTVNVDANPEEVITDETTSLNNYQIEPYIPNKDQEFININKIWEEALSRINDTSPINSTHSINPVDRVGIDEAPI